MQICGRMLMARAHRDKYAGGAGNATTRKELAALFAVIGTPSWADVDAVRSASWRSYLQRLPGKAPTLYRRLAASAGAAAGPRVHAHAVLQSVAGCHPAEWCSLGLSAEANSLSQPRRCPV